jgi:membrane associated rhomboid family serine protease
MDMRLEFYKSLITALASRDFFLLKESGESDDIYDSEISLESPAPFAKLKDGVIYIASLARRDADGGYEARRFAFGEALEDFGAVYASLFLEGDLPENAEPFENQKNYDLYWKIDFETKKIIAPPNQSTAAANIEDCVKYAFERMNYETPEIITYSDAIERGKKLSGLEVRSELFFAHGILITNVIMFALMELNGSSTDAATLIKFGALEPTRVYYLGQWYRVLTSCFLHIGPLHLMGNMLGIYIFGSRVERYLGGVRFLIIYLASGIAGSAASLAFPNFSAAAGASGCIFGLVGAVGMLSAKTRRAVDGLTISSAFAFLIYSLVFDRVQGSIVNIAHVAGFFAGLAVSFILLLFIKKKEV